MASLLLLSCDVSWAAPRQVQGWQWQRTVLPVMPITEQCVVLDADLYARSAPGLRDLRLLQSGREVAYALEESFDEPARNSPAKDRAVYTTVLRIPLHTLLPGPGEKEVVAYAGEALLAAHVPVERALLEPAPTEPYAAFRTPVRFSLAAIPLTQEPEAHSPTGEGEVINDVLPGAAPVELTAIGANLQKDAKVSVSIFSERFTTVLLQMRQRSLCFRPTSSAPMVLRFGNAAARPVHYEYAAHYRPTATPVMAQLGPVERNPQYGAEAPRRSAGTRASYNAAAGLAGAALLLLLVPVLLLRRPQPPQ